MNNIFGLGALMIFATLLIGCTNNVDVGNTTISQDNSKIVQCQQQFDSCTTRCNDQGNGTEVCKTTCKSSYDSCVR